LPTAKVLKVFFGVLSRKRKLQLIILISLNIACSGLELASIGAVGPFMLALTRPEIPFNYLVTLNIAQEFGVVNAQDVVLPITVSFVMLMFLSALFRSIVLYLGTRFSFALGSEISTACYRAYLNKPYLEIINDHTSEIINNIFININLIIYQIINPVTIFFSGLSLIISLSLLMLIVNTTGTIAAFVFLAIFYIVIHFLGKKRTKDNGVKINFESSRVIKALQDGIGGIRDIIIDGTQKAFLDLHSSADLNLRKLQASNQFISAFPRIGIETVTMILVAIAGYLISDNSDLALALPTLAIIVMAGQRLLPALQQCYVSVNSIDSSIQALCKINDLLIFDKNSSVALQKNTKLFFNNSILFKNIELQLGNPPRLILDRVNLEIRKGERIGLIGKTGSGKSTFVDVMMGLILPTNGSVEVDSTGLNSHNLKSWMLMVAHVPQSIFLTDASIKCNIAFGVPESEINIKRVVLAIERAQLTDFVHSLPEGINSIVGERGAFLSGGQRQRIGIARALYKNSQILIFDEATSALDGETEASIMECIYSLDPNLTVIVIAHRLSTLRSCSRIVEIESGRIKAIGTYEELVKNE
jgi:ATP-binding cassette subfamily B protein